MLLASSIHKRVPLLSKKGLKDNSRKIFQDINSKILQKFEVSRILTDQEDSRKFQ